MPKLSDNTLWFLGLFPFMCERLAFVAIKPVNTSLRNVWPFGFLAFFTSGNSSSSRCSVIRAEALRPERHITRIPHGPCESDIDLFPQAPFGILMMYPSHSEASALVTLRRLLHVLAESMPRGQMVRHDIVVLMLSLCFL